VKEILNLLGIDWAVQDCFNNMARIVYLTISTLIFLVLVCYLALPNFDFPDPPPGAKQSREPADSETPLRRAYFTNLTREEVMEHYKSKFYHTSFFNLILPTYRLNYPPEEATTLIRDQARSTFLEEVVHPFRESIFVNGYEPKDPKNAINIEGVHYRQKITVKLVPSNATSRIILTVLGLVALLYVVKSLISSTKEFFKI
jgi:hypothetical protein